MNNICIFLNYLFDCFFKIYDHKLLSSFALIKTWNDISLDLRRKKSIKSIKNIICLLLSSKNRIIFVKYRRVMLAENSLKPNYSNYSFVCTPLLVFFKQCYHRYIFESLFLGYIVVPLFNQNFKCFFFFSIFFHSGIGKIKAAARLSYNLLL